LERGGENGQADRGVLVEQISGVKWGENRKVTGVLGIRGAGERVDKGGVFAVLERPRGLRRGEGVQPEGRFPKKPKPDI